MKINTIIRKVTVNRQRTSQEMLAAHSSYRKSVDEAILENMPRGIGAETEVVFFNVGFNFGRWIKDSDINRVCAELGLVLADPFSLAAVNEADPEFAYNHRNATHWQDPLQGRSQISFRIVGSLEEVGTYRLSVRPDASGGYEGQWWLAGIPK